jgi:hypothetical protein
MFSDVATRNVATGVNENVFRIIKGMQMDDVDVSDELCSNRSKRENDSQVLTMNEILFLHHQLIVADMVMSRRRKDLQSHPQLGTLLQKWGVIY